VDTIAPIFSAPVVGNICPTPSVDLTGIVATNKPAGSNLQWHSQASVIDSSTLITNSTVAVDSIFYATFYDTINDCYSPTTAVTVIIDNDCCTDPNLFADNCDCDGDGLDGRGRWCW